VPVSVPWYDMGREKVAVVATVWFWWDGDPGSVFMGTRGK
jgi:hypothetical protein